MSPPPTAIRFKWAGDGKQRQQQGIRSNLRSIQFDRVLLCTLYHYLGIWGAVAAFEPRRFKFRPCTNLDFQGKLSKCWWMAARPFSKIGVPQTSYFLDFPFKMTSNLDSPQIPRSWIHPRHYQVVTELVVVRRRVLMSSKEAILDILLSVNIKNILKQYSINIRKTKSYKVTCTYIYI